MGGGQRTILCTGDSFTYGLGASAPENSYPARLQAILRERTGDAGWRVVNCGWPGQDSRDVVQRLAEQLTTYQPALVYVIVGCNDYWTRPELTDASTAAAPDHRFQWRWRTGRLLAVVTSLLRGSRTIPQPAAGVGADGPAQAGFPTGVWHFHNLCLDFGQHGELSVAWNFPRIAVARIGWSAQADRLTLTFGEGAQLPLIWQLRGLQLVLGTGAQPELVTLDSGHANQSKLQQVLQGHLARAVGLCRQQGAIPVLASYPAPMQGVAEAMSRVVTDASAGWVDLVPAFDEALRTRRREELFIYDGHCADAGYQLMAQQIADDVLQRLTH
jgi:lysophospholipase L1-like esterase